MNVKHPGHPDLTSPGLVPAEYLPAENKLVLFLVEIRQVVLLLFFTGTSLATVSRHVSASVGKGGYGQHAVVSALAAAPVFRVYGKIRKLVRGECSGALALDVVLPRDYRCTESAHES